MNTVSQTLFKEYKYLEARTDFIDFTKIFKGHNSRILHIPQQPCTDWAGIFGEIFNMKIVFEGS